MSKLNVKSSADYSARKRAAASANRAAFNVIITADMLDDNGFVVDEHGDPIVVQAALAISENTPFFDETDNAPARTIATAINVALVADDATAKAIANLTRKSWEDYTDAEKDLVDASRVTITFWDREYSLELPNGREFKCNPFDFVKEIAEQRDGSAITQVELYGLRFRANEVVDEHGDMDSVVLADVFGVKGLTRKVGATRIGGATTTSSDVKSAISSKLKAAAAAVIGAKPNAKQQQQLPDGWKASANKAGWAFNAKGEWAKIEDLLQEEPAFEEPTFPEEPIFQAPPEPQSRKRAK